MGIRRRVAVFTPVLLVVFALTAAAATLYASAAPSLQYSDLWCEFKLDYEGDGEGNQTFDPETSDYLPQETGILAECNFTYTAEVKATVQFDAQLDNWRAEVVATEEPSGRKIVEDTVHVGNREIEVPAGGMVINAKLINGSTPRGEGRTDLPQGYVHQLQLPFEFLLLEIAVVDGAGNRDRVVSHEATAASNAYIEASQNIAGAAASPDALALANELLSEGYPSISERVATLPLPPPEEGGVSFWMWIAIVLAVLLVTVVIILIINLLNRSGVGVQRPPPRPRRR